MEIKGFRDQDKVNKVHDMNKDRPIFMQSMDKKYIYLNKYCFEFNQWGVANKNIFRKSITYPPDLWEVIKENFESDTQFKQELGIRPRSYRPCMRYDMHPFERSDTVY